MTRDDLIAFEADIAERFNRGEIRAPVHLAGGNEDELIRIAEEFRPGDYFFSTWRSHYHALLAGVPPEKVRGAILAGRSITLAWPEHRFLSSAIVAGCCPIALGVAWQIKRAGGGERVWCFIGDMAARSGLYHECLRYATGFDLPVKFVREMNRLSVCSDPFETWGTVKCDTEEYERGYFYKLPWPHAGAGVRVQF